MEFANRVSALTGAASGIGRALAVELARRGSDLAIADLDAEGLEATSERVRALGRRVESWTLDVSDREAMEAFAAQTVERFGRVDAIVNNAGVTVAQRFVEMSHEDLEWIVGVNFWGVVHGTKAFLPYLLERREGWVVNLSSILGMVGAPTQSAYCATKFAVRGLSESLHHELEGTGVHLVSVHPGGVKTNIARRARFFVDLQGGDDHESFARNFDALARTSPEQAARRIVRGMIRKERRVLVGPDAHLLDALQRILPIRHAHLFARTFGRRI
ncbi:MAG: SDR family NAD(P)-dependent oxidoreductase [Myxococcales bacterium]|nr:SDR family NAD(P)-dependent oxidoreductase [Myxococcales bacterium]